MKISMTDIAQIASRIPSITAKDIFKTSSSVVVACSALIAVVLVATTGTAEAQVRAKSLSKTCPKVQLVGSESATIYKNSAPLRSGGVGTPLIGYRREPTLIYNRRNFSGSRHVVYDSKGKSLASCPVVSAEGHAGRARCTIQTSSLRRSAVGNTGSPTVYFKVSGNLCVKVPDAGRCYGSVKGLCNQLIK
jgi:hypothetical protein